MLIIVVRVCKAYINDIHFKNTFNLAEIIFAFETLHSQNIKPIALFNYDISYKNNQRTDGPVNAHLISWPSKAQSIQNLEIYGKEMTLIFDTHITS